MRNGEFPVTSQEKLQELRNWVHEEFFREQHHATVTGDTYTVNFLQAMLTKLDVEFGTKYEKTASQIKQEAVVEVEQGTLFEEGEG